MDKSALIGFTGFVGGNLAAKHQFTDLYNSKNIGEIDGKEYDLVISAGAGAEMWRINQDPQPDLDNIDSLIEHLKTIGAKQFVLISSVCVFADFVGHDENSKPTGDILPYGVHRLKLEAFVREHFPGALIVRLPGLFGPGLKKNVIYDLLHDNNVDRIHPGGSFQYYNLEHLWDDIQTALKNNIELLHITSEPITTAEIARDVFGMELPVPQTPAPKKFDLKSIHAETFGGHNGYLYTKEQVIDDIKAYVQKQKAAM
jgi:nucleoside-diphosphate-sugar epimerase